LIEKAFAKIYGNYIAMEDGDCSHSMMDLTGCPVMTYSLHD